MSRLLDHAKHAARRLQRSIERGAVPAPAGVPPGEAVKRRHCVHSVATRLGFRSWTHARSVLLRAEPADRGTFMFHDTGGAVWNIWSASYSEARAIRTSSGGYLLPYKHQFQIVEAPYVELLGLDPAHPDWEAIGRNWIEPADGDAWERIARRRIDILLC